MGDRLGSPLGAASFFSACFSYVNVLKVLLCVVLLFPDIAQLVERSTVEPAVIEWSLVRFRVSGLLNLALFNFRSGFKIKERSQCLAARLAQLVERQPFKLVVVGSSPTVGILIFVSSVLLFNFLKLRYFHSIKQQAPWPNG